MLAGTLSNSTLTGVQTLLLCECLHARTCMHICNQTHIQSVKAVPHFQYELVELPRVLVAILRYYTEGTICGGHIITFSTSPTEQNDYHRHSSSP